MTYNTVNILSNCNKLIYIPAPINSDSYIPTIKALQVLEDIRRDMGLAIATNKNKIFNNRVFGQR